MRWRLWLLWWVVQWWLRHYDTTSETLVLFPSPTLRWLGCWLGWGYLSTVSAVCSVFRSSVVPSLSPIIFASKEETHWVTKSSVRVWWKVWFLPPCVDESAPAVEQWCCLQRQPSNRRDLPWLQCCYSSPAAVEEVQRSSLWEASVLAGCSFPRSSCWLCWVS